MIKIVTIDLDGTLFDKDKVISEENKIAINKCKELGCKIVIATGRPISGVRPVLEELGLTGDDDYAIIYNGSKIFNVGTNKMIFSSSIDGKRVKEIYKESIRLNTFFHAFRVNEELIVNIPNPYTDVESKINHVEAHTFNMESIKDDDKFLKAMLVCDKDSLDVAQANVDKKYYTENTMVRSSNIFLEFLNKNSDKGQALEQLAKYLGVDLKDTMAIGDAGNDLPMILKAGIGVSMANGFKEVLENADYVTINSNQDSGVAEALYKFVINA